MSVKLLTYTIIVNTIETLNFNKYSFTEKIKVEYIVYYCNISPDYAKTIYAKSSGGSPGTDSSASVVQRRTEGKADDLYPMLPQQWQIAFSLIIL